jgi:hypothetical protein
MISQSLISIGPNQCIDTNKNIIPNCHHQHFYLIHSNQPQSDSSNGGNSESSEDDDIMISSSEEASSSSSSSSSSEEEDEEGSAFELPLMKRRLRDHSDSDDHGESGSEEEEETRRLDDDHSIPMIATHVPNQPQTHPLPIERLNQPDMVMTIEQRSSIMPIPDATTLLQEQQQSHGIMETISIMFDHMMIWVGIYSPPPPIQVTLYHDASSQSSSLMLFLSTINNYDVEITTINDNRFCIAYKDSSCSLKIFPFENYQVIIKNNDHHNGIYKIMTVIMQSQVEQPPYVIEQPVLKPIPLERKQHLTITGKIMLWIIIPSLLLTIFIYLLYILSWNKINNFYNEWKNKRQQREQIRDIEASDIPYHLSIDQKSAEINHDRDAAVFTAPSV